MKTIIIMTLLCIGAFGETYFLSTDDKLSSSLKTIDQTDFGKNLLDTIALQLSSNTPMSDVADLI